MRRNIYDLRGFDHSIYDSGESAEYDLITEYMLNNNLASQIHNENERARIGERIQRLGEGGRTLNLGNFCCKS